MSNILVTGGAGFVGSHLCERLKNDGHKVVSVDNYFTGSVDNHVPGVTYINLDTKNIMFDLELVNTKFDYIYHLGEYSRVEQSFEDFHTVWRFNTLGIKSMLEFAKTKKAKFIYAGSSTKFAVTDPLYIQSPYAWSKESNTKLVKLFCEHNDIDYAITYFYNVYGPREIKSGDYATLIALFQGKMERGDPLTVVSPGTQKRNFTHVNDIVDGLVLVGEQGYDDEYGIGSPDSYTVLEVAKMFGGDIKMLPERKGNRMSAQIVTLRTKELGWSVKHNLQDYIDEWKKK